MEKCRTQHGEIEDTPHEYSLEWDGYGVSALVDSYNQYLEPVTNMSRAADPTGILDSCGGLSLA